MNPGEREGVKSLVSRSSKREPSGSLTATPSPGPGLVPEGFHVACFGEVPGNVSVAVVAGPVRLAPSTASGAACPHGTQGNTAARNNSVRLDAMVDRHTRWMYSVKGLSAETRFHIAERWLARLSPPSTRRSSCAKC